MGGAGKLQVLDRQPVGCVLYMNPSLSVPHRNHTEQDHSSHLASGAEVHEGPWFRRSLTVR